MTSAGSRSVRTPQYFVGGNTKVYGAILFRMRERDFQDVEHYAGVSPRWPISYADLEPYYTRGRAPVPRARPGGRGPDRAAAVGPIPLSPRSPTSREYSNCTTIFSAPGHRPFHLPVGVDLDETDPEKSRCVRCDRFDGFPCLTDGKADAHVRCVRPALEHTTNLTLLTHARVERLETRRIRAAVTKPS